MVIHNNLRLGVVVHGVDGEVAAHRVFLLGAPDVVAQNPTGRINRVFHTGQLIFTGAFVTRHRLGSGIVHVGPEGRDLDDLVFTTTAKNNVHDAKPAADDKSAPEQVFNLLGGGVGRHIKILGTQTHHQVAHGSADNIGFEPGLFQGSHDSQSTVIDQRGVNAMGLHPHLLALAKLQLLGFGGRGGLAQ